MAFYAERMSGSNLETSTSAPDGPCYDPAHVPPHTHHQGSRWHPLALVAVTAVATLLVLGGAFLSGFYYRGSLIQVSTVALSAKGDTAIVAPISRAPLVNEEEVITRLYENAGPAVVKIIVVQRGEIDLTGSDARGDSVGSGVIFDAKGYIVTNHHVVEGAADVVVRLANGDLARAQVLGQDSSTDLAVLQIDLPPEGLTVASFADSDTLNVGQFAVAIGHPFGLDKSLTVGHISGLGRMTPTRDKYSPVIEDMIQTDAAINPGNSGGPLFNLQGEVVGINTSIFSTSRGSQGVGFAVPSNTVQKIIAELLDKGYVSRPFLGVFGLPLNAQQAEFLGLKNVDHGLLIQEVSQGSPAWLAGLRPGDETIRVGRVRIRVGGDVLLALDGQPVNDPGTISKILQERTIGDTITLTIHRAGQEIELTATLSERPATDGL